MKKRLLFITLLLCVTLTAFGCKKKDKASDKADTEAQTEESGESTDDGKDGGLKSEDEPVKEEPSKEPGEEEEDDGQFVMKPGVADTFESSWKYVHDHANDSLVLNYALDVYEPAERKGDEKPEDIHEEIEKKTEGDTFRKVRFNRADRGGSFIDISAYTDPSTLMIDKIVTCEYCADAREMSEFYFKDGRLVYAYTYTDGLYGTEYKDGTLPGKKCTFKDNVMTGCIIDDKDVGNKKVAYEARDYDNMDEFTKASYDEVEQDILKRAYITYNYIAKVPGFAYLYGYVGDEQGGVLSNVHMKISSKAHEYEREFVTNGDGFFEMIVPINEEDDYGIVCEYGDYVPSTVDDIRIRPGTVDYPIGVIYMAPAGQNIHDANTYLLNANYSSPKKLSEGEYCVTLSWEDKNADLTCVGMNLKKQKRDQDKMMVVKPGKDGQFKYFVIDKRGINSGNPMTYELSSSKAVVKVYDKDGLVASYQAPVGRAGTVWEVFEITDGKIMPLSNLMIETEKSPLLR
ncbi:MAG: carboxypeptidase regulatory-like domain-containing protein [Lachnospiraceae bacterium]|nr:carboxypeptidase regulatory-like domain-containing protein [Lachnospiraceae bacterium]